MEWAKKYHRGWYIYWNKNDGRFYAKENSLFGGVKNFRGRYDYLKAMTIAEDWIDRER